MRDVAAAQRFIRATATKYGTDTARIAAYGFSAGGVAVVSLGLLLDGDYASEISEAEDPTLATTHPSMASGVAVVADLWGGAYAAEALRLRDGRARCNPWRRHHHRLRCLPCALPPPPLSPCHIV